MTFKSDFQCVHCFQDDQWQIVPLPTDTLFLYPVWRCEGHNCAMHYIAFEDRLYVMALEEVERYIPRSMWTRAMRDHNTMLIEFTSAYAQELEKIKPSDWMQMFHGAFDRKDHYTRDRWVTPKRMEWKENSREWADWNKWARDGSSPYNAYINVPDEEPFKPIGYRTKMFTVRLK